jgi:hypothetical protein
MAAPDPESLERIADFYARFYHETPSEDEAAEEARISLSRRAESRAALVQAFDDFLAADLPPGTLQEFVRRHANRLTADDEHARQFIVASYRALGPSAAP